MGNINYIFPKKEDITNILRLNRGKILYDMLLNTLSYVIVSTLVIENNHINYDEEDWTLI